MGILGAIVRPPFHSMAAFQAEFSGSGGIGWKLVGRYPVGREAVFLQKLARQFHSSGLVSLRLHEHVEDFALGVDGSPQIDHAARDFQIHLIQVPGPARLGDASAQVRSNCGSKIIHPAPNALTRNHNPALRQQVFYIAKAQGESEVEPNRLLDDLLWEAISVIADFPHSLGYPAAGPPASSKRRDNARRTKGETTSVSRCATSRGG
jgi:hypothetical protein